MRSYPWNDPASLECSRIRNVHTELSNEIGRLYRLRDKDPGALDAAIEACVRQIALGPLARQAFFAYGEEIIANAERFKLPLSARDRKPENWVCGHDGYRQLAIIREKQGDFAEAIRLCKEAKSQGWTGDWSERIAKLKKRAQRDAITNKNKGVI